MTAALAVLVLSAVAFLAGAVLFVVSVVRTHREQRRWIEERERLAKAQERMAASNGRPHTDAVISRATRRS